MIAAALLAVASSASAQFEDTTEPIKDAPKAPTYSLMAKRPIHEISLYMQDGWGLGYQLRKDINRYIAWNIIGASYMVEPIKCDPSYAGIVNFRFFGVRLNSPSYKKNFRFYTDLTMGYTLTYKKVEKKVNTMDHFGLDFGVGMQIGKHFTIGYNLNFVKGDDLKKTTHWAKISCLF